MPTFIHRSRILAPAAAVFDWHARPGAFQRLTPPWEAVELVEQTGGIQNGARVVLRVGPRPVALRWVAEHRDYVAGRQFKDVQVSGPFTRWEHTHSVEPDGEHACWLQDAIDYELPGGKVAEVLGGARFTGKLQRMFAYRHQTTAADVLSHQRFADRPRLRVAIAGGTGLVGRALAAFLTTGGHTVRCLTRKPKGSDDIGWNPSQGSLDVAQLADNDAIVNLAGENIAAGRWTATRKQALLESRLASTRLLTDALIRSAPRPRTFITASAIGFYGDRGDELLDETSSSGFNFLADVCRQWEAASEPVAAVARRVVTRFGVVLTPAGGALGQMLTPFQLGMGGIVGSGRQWMSWVSLDDVVETIHAALMHDDLRGTLNTVSPQPVTNAEFTAALGRALRRPTIVPMPAGAARLAFGQLADELLLASARVQPARLQASGFVWRHPTIKLALDHLLGNE